MCDSDDWFPDDVLRCSTSNCYLIKIFIHKTIVLVMLQHPFIQPFTKYTLIRWKQNLAKWFKASDNNFFWRANTFSWNMSKCFDVIIKMKRRRRFLTSCKQTTQCQRANSYEMLNNDIYLSWDRAHCHEHS